MTDITAVKQHPFITRPNRTILALSIPVFFSLIAEPLTGLVDTAFISRLGAEPLAALGVGTAALSSVFWIFNFLAVGTQTNVAQAMGQDQRGEAISISSLALILSAVFGLLLILLGWFWAPTVASLLGADEVLLSQAVTYMRIRLFGAPAVIMLLTAFGALRGLQDMRTPLWIALVLNGMNIALDAVLIPGLGPIPGYGIAGAAAASVFAQSVGAVWAVAVVVRKLGWTKKLNLSQVRHLFKIGFDLFIRTGLLTLYLLLTTRVATQAGATSGAAHQALRQFWVFTALGLDALAITAQSLVGFFIGSKWREMARRVAFYSCAWGLALGVLMSAAMWLGEDLVAALLVPAEAHYVFSLPWLVLLLIQPVNSLAFVTDGIHWGTADFAYLRNAVFFATLIGTVLLLLIDTSAPDALLWIWSATAVWITIRTIFGVIRIWPGIGRAPLKSA